MKKGCRFVFIEWTANGVYHGANYAEENVPIVLSRLRDQRERGVAIPSVSVDDLDIPWIPPAPSPTKRSR